MSVFKYEKDEQGIVTVTMDMTGPVNAINAEYTGAMDQTVGRLEAEEGLSGVVFASAKKVFFAGADLNELVLIDASDGEALFTNGELIKGHFRRLEKLPVPVVAAINGAALCLSLIHIRRCRRSTLCRSRWSPPHSIKKTFLSYTSDSHD